MHYRIRKLLGAKMEREERAISLAQAAREAGVGRVVLTRMANNDNYVTSTDKLEALCRYFGCRLDELVEFVPSPGPRKSSPAPRKIVTGARRKPAGKAPRQRK